MHSHNHSHHHHHHGTGKILQWSSAITVLFVIVEVIAGIRAHSLALLADAGHNFTDALALVLAAIAVFIQTRPPNEVKTYGYHRAGVLAAFVNALTLIAISIWIFFESWQRLLHPEPVAEWTMLVVAGIGLLVNGSIMAGLHHDRHDLNVRAAFVHMLGDALGSSGIMVGAVLIYFTKWQGIDAILSLLIGVLIIWSAWDIIKESLNILLEGLPRGLQLNSVITEMGKVAGVIDVHDVHIWTLGTNAHALSCHIQIADMPPSESESILKQINEVLCGYHIHHTTVQFEHAKCESECSILVPHEH
ncbi:MAG: cation diffusion facilitator family transporter [Bryobacteraceae bacterium]